MTVTMSDSGMAVSVMHVVRKLKRKKNKTTTTRRAPSRNASLTFLIARSMKALWRKISVCTVTPFGKVSFTFAISRSMALVSEAVSALGCFWMLKMTAGLPLTPASPRLVSGPPKRTWAT